MTRESLLSENRKLKRRCPALFLMCNRTLGTTGPHFLVQLLRRDHSQVETALRPQRQHHPLPRLLPEEGWGHHALQVRLLPARSWLIKAPVSPDVHSTTANYIYVLFLSKQGWKCRPIRRRTTTSKMTRSGTKPRCPIRRAAAAPVPKQRRSWRRRSKRLSSARPLRTTSIMRCLNPGTQGMSSRHARVLIDDK